MNNSQTILVTGATGAQGGSVARHLLARKKFKVRCLTRHPESDKARELQDQGAEVVKGDFDDIESLRQALSGCHGVFGVTNFWEHFDKEHEQGKHLVDAVAAAGVQHFVFSTLKGAKQNSGGELEAPHLDIKAELEEYTRQIGVPATFVHVAFYYENFFSFFPPRKQEDGSYGFGFPQGDTKLAAVCVEDTGEVVAPIFEQRENYLGRAVGVVGDDLPPADYAAIMSRELNEKITYTHIPREVFAAFGFPGAEDLANMFDFNRRFVPDRQQDLEQSRELNPDMKSFAQWVRENADKLRAVLAG